MKKLRVLSYIFLIVLISISGCNRKVVEEEVINSILDGMAVELEEAFIDVSKNGVAADTDTVQTTALNDLLSANSSESLQNTLFFPKGVYRIDGQVNVPLEVTFAFEEGAMLSLGKSSQVKFSGAVMAYGWQVFEGEGDILGILNNERVYPQWFGAKGDGETEDSEAFRRAIAHSNEIAVPFTEKGYVLKDITVPSVKRIYGLDAKKSIIIGYEDCENLFTFLSGTKEVKISNFSLDMSKTGESTCFFFNAETLGCTYFEIWDIDTFAAYNVVRDARVPPNKIYSTNLLFRDFSCKSTRGSAVETGNFWGFVFFRDMLFDNSGIYADCGIKGNYPAFLITDNAGAILQNLEIIGSGDDENNEEDGFLYIDDVATWMQGCTISNVGGDAIDIDGGSHLYFSDITINKPFEDGMIIRKTVYVQANNINITGTGQESGGDAGHGINLVEARQVQINDSVVRKMSKNGIFLNGAIDSIVTGTTIQDNLT
ncbi:MAG: right-handed parallel beta-helix repeat-containing protein, partial [Saccharofermentanales bacterium]